MQKKIYKKGEGSYNRDYATERMHFLKPIMIEPKRYTLF